MVGEILVDTDVPNKHTELLQIGYTLNDGEESRSFLSQELLSPYSFEKGWQEWKQLGGNVYFDRTSEGKNNIQYSLKAIVSKKDSICGIQIRDSLSFPVFKGDEYIFKGKAYSKGLSTIEVSLVKDSIGTPLSPTISIRPSNDWNEVTARLKVQENSEKASLRLVFKTRDEGQTLTSDSLRTFIPQTASVYLTSPTLKLNQADTTSGSPLSPSLVQLLTDLEPSFLRYPSGNQTHNAFPMFLDSLMKIEKKKPSTLSYKQFIKLSKKMSAIPILMTDAGYNTKPTYYSQLVRQINDQNVILQLGYNSEGIQYFYRAHAIVQQLEEDSLQFHIINSGSILPFRKFSDYPYDRALSPVKFEELPQLDSLIRAHDFLAEPQLLGEVYFQDSTSHQYSVPPLVLRAAFLVLAERNSQYLEGIGVAPLLSSHTDKEYPLILVSGGHYQPSEFYQYIQLFSTLRGENLKGTPSNEPFEDGLILSLSADSDGANYYLKAVNTTRHPLPFLVKLKGRKTKFSSATIHSFTIGNDSISENYRGRQYHLYSEDIKINMRQRFDYEFKPFEIAIFHFKQE